MLQERERFEEEYLQVIGNTDIPTRAGLININVNPQAFRDELVSEVDSYYQDNPIAKNNGRTKNRRLVVAFTNQSLANFLYLQAANKLADPSLDKFEKEYINSILDIPEKYRSRLGMFLQNPMNPGEYIILLNIPAIGESLETKSELERAIQNVWIHERHHFVQESDPGINGRRWLDKELTEFTFPVAGALLVGGTSGLATGMSTYFITRRQLLGVFAGGAVGLVGMAAGYIGGYNAAIHLPFSIEGEARHMVRSSTYTLDDFRQTFTVIAQ